MGLVRMGPPRELVTRLKEVYQLEDFIETGTYHGNTAVWAASQFDNAITIEFSKEIYQETVARHDKINNIDFIHGNSKFVLRMLAPKLTRPSVFWLDAHWSGGKSYGEGDGCPIIDEIRAINLSPQQHFIFIDDARLFTSPPPRPHRVEHWPSIKELIEALTAANHEYYLVIIEDVIIAVPEYAKELVTSYCQQVNTEAWEDYGDHLQEPAIKQGCLLIGQGIRLVVGRGLRVQLKHLVSRRIMRISEIFRLYR